MKMRIWWIVNIFWLLVFIADVIFVLVRKVDGAGVVQTPQLRIAAVFVSIAFLIFIALCQWLALYFIKRSEK